MRIPFSTSLAFLLLAPIAHAQPLTSLQSTIHDRTGATIAWRNDSITDSQVTAAVHHLLQRPLTASTAVQIALLNNRDLQATFEKIGIAQADLVEAGLLKNPVFTASPRFPDKPPGAADVELSVAQDFLDLIILPLRKRVAARQLAETVLEVGDSILKLAADTRAAFYQYQAAGQILDAACSASTTSDAAAQLSTRLHDAGNISDLDLAVQQAESSQSRAEIMAAKLDADNAREKLNRLMCLYGSDLDWKAITELPSIPTADPPEPSLESLALGRRLDLAATEAQWHSLVEALHLTRTYRYIGTIELGADTERQTDGQRITGPTLSLELPLFNHGQGRIARLQAQLRQVERTIESQAIDIRSEVREAATRAAAQRTLAIYYRDDLGPVRKRILDLTTTQYNSMLKGGYDLLLARQNQLSAQRGFIQALRDYWIARADLERATGGLTNSATSSHVNHH